LYDFEVKGTPISKEMDLVPTDGSVSWLYKRKRQGAPFDRRRVIGGAVRDKNPAPGRIVHVKEPGWGVGAGSIKIQPVGRNQRVNIKGHFLQIL